MTFRDGSSSDICGGWGRGGEIVGIVEAETPVAEIGADDED